MSLLTGLLGIIFLASGGGYLLVAIGTLTTGESAPADMPISAMLMFAALFLIIGYFLWRKSRNIKKQKEVEKQLKDARKMTIEINRNQNNPALNGSINTNAASRKADKTGTHDQEGSATVDGSAQQEVISYTPNGRIHTKNNSLQKNQCEYCGEIIPEDVMICPHCHMTVASAAK